MKSVLLIGQSNMAGRGFLHEVKPILDERIMMLRNGRWQMMTEPVHFDRSVAGVGPAASFAKAWCNANNDRLGLIPCAEGGSSIDEWAPEGVLFRHAITEAKFAMEESELTAILWHQGESDSREEKYRSYYSKLEKMVNALREELNVPEIPFIMGGLGDYLGKSGFGLSCTEYENINNELQRYAMNNKNCYFVTGEKLFPNPDGIHIDAESQRRFGIRYFMAYQNGADVSKPIENEDQMVEELYNKEYTAAEKRYMALEKMALGKSDFEELKKVMA